MNSIPLQEQPNLQDVFEKDIPKAGVWFDDLTRDGKGDYVHHATHSAFAMWKVAKGL